MKEEIKELVVDDGELIAYYKDGSFETFDTLTKEVLEHITNLQKEVEDLREDNYAYHQLMKMQNKREYRSKFLKEFQQEYNTNTFPDYDEIYKRYDKLKKEIERLNNIIDEFYKLLIEHIEDARYELNIILHSDNDLNYKNECAREFDVLDKNIRMILDKLKELKENKNEIEKLGC